MSFRVRSTVYPGADLPARRHRIYSSYINGFDDALARIQSWAKPTPSRSPLLPGPISPAIGGLASYSYSYDAAAGIQSTLSSSQKKRIKSWLKVR